MKKQKLKLGLKKVKISDLSLIKGGQREPETDSCGCPYIAIPYHSDACVETWETTCYSGHLGC